MHYSNERDADKKCPHAVFDSEYKKQCVVEFTIKAEILSDYIVSKSSL